MTTAASRTLGCRALVAASCALAIAACGSSGPTPTGFGTTATGDASPFALSHCMRSHGVSNFPDPTAGPGGEGFNGVVSSPGSDTLTVDGIMVVALAGVAAPGVAASPARRRSCTTVPPICAR
jgi:hypothetical protein